MENPEEILHSLEEFSKMKPKDIPRELEEYLCFVAKTGNPVYQWPIIKSLFREKLVNVITEFYESCPTMDIPPCPNVEMFNYDMMKNFILEKLDTFAAAPFTVQRICELLTSPRKEYNRIDKYMRALEKNILVVSTTEPGRRSTENGDGVMNGIEFEHLPEGQSVNSSSDINIEDMDETPSNWSRHEQGTPALYKVINTESVYDNDVEQSSKTTSSSFENESETKTELPSSSTAEEPKSQAQETVITCTSSDEQVETYVHPEPQENIYQNLSEESNSNSSDSSNSMPVSESKEVVEQKEEITEDTSDIKEDTIVPPQDQEETSVAENIITESTPVPESITEEPSSEVSESTTEAEPSELPAQVLPEPQQLPEESLVVETTNSEAEEKSDATETPTEEKIEEDPKEPEIELALPEETTATIPQESDDVADSSTDVKTEELTVASEEEQVNKSTTQDETTKESEATSSDAIVEEKAKSEETPMEVDEQENPEKKSENEEPSSSVESFVKLMTAYYSRD